MEPTKDVLATLGVSGQKDGDVSRRRSGVKASRLSGDQIAAARLLVHERGCFCGDVFCDGCFAADVSR